MRVGKLETASIENFPTNFCCRKNGRNGAVAERGSAVKEEFLFLKMKVIRACLLTKKYPINMEKN